MEAINLIIKIIAIIIWSIIFVAFFADLYNRVNKEYTKTRRGVKLATPFTDKLFEQFLNLTELDPDFREDDYYIALSRYGFRQLIAENPYITDPKTGQVYIFGIKVNQFETQIQDILFIKR